MSDAELIAALSQLREDIKSDTREIVTGIVATEIHRFHREVAMPEVKEFVTEFVSGEIGALRDEMNTHFDGVYHRLDRLETDFTAMKNGLKRVEKRLDRLEQVS
jgi:hypothetical protein